jgi:hypothetical protein
VTATFDEPEFLETGPRALPGQEGGPNLMLVQYKDDREFRVGHGPRRVGLVSRRLERPSHDRALACDAGEARRGVRGRAASRIAVLNSPTGHRDRTVQLP